MAIKAIVDKLEDAPEALRAEYRPGTADEGADGKFVLNVDGVGGFTLENVSGLKSALGKERTSRETLERQVVAFKDLDPEKARAALVELEQLRAIDPTKEADKIANSKFEAAKTQLLEQHGKEIGARDTRIQLLSGVVDGALRRQEAVQAIADAKGSVELLLPHVLAHTKLTEADGKFRTDVVDKDGNVRIADAKGTPMDIKGLVAEMRGSETFARAFDGDGQSGSGKKLDTGGGGGAPAGDWGGSRTEREAAIARKFNLPAS